MPATLQHTANEIIAELVSKAATMHSALKLADDLWTKDFPLGPASTQINDDHARIWRTIRDALAKAEGKS